MRKVIIYPLVFLSFIMPVYAMFIIFLCTNIGGSEGPTLEIHLKSNIVFVGTNRNPAEITGSTDRYITYIMKYKVGAAINVIDLGTGIHKSIFISNASNGKLANNEIIMNCRKSII